MSKLGVLIWRYLFESGDAKRLKKQVQDLSDLRIRRDMKYIDDGEQGHLFDIYELPELPEDAPVLINIHGGGLFASYKEVNVNFNYEWARLGYWNMVHGNTSEEVLQDKEGLQIMRVLGRNMAWLLKLKAAGEAAGVATPKQEEARIATNFIR